MPPDYESAETVATKTKRRSVAALARRIPEPVWWLAYALFSVFILIGLIIALEATFFFKDAKKAEGEVVRVERKDDYTEGSIFYAIVRFKRADGKVVERRSHTPQGTYKNLTGKRVEIYYSPRYPGQVRIADFVSIYFGAIFFILFGLLFIILVYWVRDKARHAVVMAWDEAGQVHRIAEEAARLRAGSAGRAQADPPTLRRRR